MISARFFRLATNVQVIQNIYMYIYCIYFKPQYQI